MAGLRLSPGQRAAIHAHAVSAYPSECCGLGTARRGEPDRLSRWHACENAQDRFHAFDPGSFPRRSAEAYYIAPKRLFEVVTSARREGEYLRLIVHSHCDAPACFSDEDVRHALFEGEPVHPGADYLVLSVTAQGVVDEALFRWQPGAGFLRETPE